MVGAFPAAAIGSPGAIAALVTHCTIVVEKVEKLTWGYPRANARAGIVGAVIHLPDACEPW